MGDRVRRGGFGAYPWTHLGSHRLVLVFISHRDYIVHTRDYPPTFVEIALRVCAAHGRHVAQDIGIGTQQLIGANPDEGSYSDKCPGLLKS